MRPSASSNAAERAYHPGGGRTPVARTPRRETGGTPATVVTAAGGSHARERALQDPGLKDYVRCSSSGGITPKVFGETAGRPKQMPAAHLGDESQIPLLLIWKREMSG